MMKRIAVKLVGILCSVAMLGALAETPGQLRERINQGTVTIISGGVNGTYVRIASDLSNVLDEGYELRVLSILGKGSVQNIDDLLYLRGIDIGIVQSDVLTFVRKENKHPTIADRLRFITKLYNEEFHLLGSDTIASIRDLEGKEVNFGVSGSGTYMTASIVFETLGIAVNPTTFDQQLALEKVKSGEIAALVYVAGKPTGLFKDQSAGEGVHFIPVEYTPELLETYLPSRLVHDDYPQLVAEGEEVETLAVGAVMAVYSHQPESDRYNKVGRFVKAFFTRFDEFQQPPRHPKWLEVNLQADLPGWQRFKPAAELLQALAAEKEQQQEQVEAPAGSSAELRQAFEQFLSQRSEASPVSESDKDQLFEEFVRWFNRQEAATSKQQ